MIEEQPMVKKDNCADMNKDPKMMTTTDKHQPKGDPDRPRFVSESGDSDDSGFEGLEGLEPFDLGVASDDFRGFQSQPSMDSGVDEEGSEAGGGGGDTSGIPEQMPDVSFFSVAMQMRLKDKEAKVSSSD